MNRHRWIAAIAACLAVLVVGGSAAAISTTNQVPLPSGQEPEVESPQSAPPAGATTTSARRSAKAAPASVTGLLEDVGLREPLLVREVDGLRVYLSTTAAPDSICISAENAGSGRLTSSCQSRDTLRQGHLWVGIGGTAESVDRMVGAVPDGVDTVLLTDDAGVSRRVAVTGNVYVAREQDRQSVKRIEWTASDGSRADLRLPAAE